MNIAAIKATLHFEDVDSPVGRLRLIASGDALVGIWFSRGRDAARGASGLVNASSPVLELTRAQLGEYFAGERREFDLPLDPRGTEFQQRVWQRLLHIEYGETTTYGALGQRTRQSQRLARRGAREWQQSHPHRHSLSSGHRSQRSLTGFGGGLPIKARCWRWNAPQGNRACSKRYW